MDKKELVQRVAERLKKEPDKIEPVIDTTLDEIYDSLARCESVTIKNFGTFYVRSEREKWVFKFNPSQRLRKLFGWSSTYKG
jgi:DNA-binding protein HU-beta